METLVASLFVQRRCRRCGTFFTERDALGRRECRLHPAARTATGYACCRRSSSVGCVAYDHSDDDSTESVRIRRDAARTLWTPAELEGRTYTTDGDDVVFARP